MKFNPGLAYYRGYPQLIVTNNSNVKKVSEELKDFITVKGNKIEINDLNNWNERHEEILEENNVEVKNSDEDFIFNVESWGQLSCKEMLLKALDVFNDKLTEFESKLKKAK